MVGMGIAPPLFENPGSCPGPDIMRNRKLCALLALYACHLFCVRSPGTSLTAAFVSSPGYLQFGSSGIAFDPNRLINCCP